MSLYYKKECYVRREAAFLGTADLRNEGFKGEHKGPTITVTVKEGTAPGGAELVKVR